MALTYPWFLLGLLSVAVPISIHLFELRRPKRVLFTNVGFIREVKLVTARQHKLKHLLVLLARIGFLIFLVLMFVQPYIPAAVDDVTSSSKVDVIVDTTPSMQVESTASEQSIFEQAITQARDLPSAYSANTSFTMLNDARHLVSATAYQASLDKLKVSGQSGALDELINKEPVNDRTAGQLFVFSDFQKNSFSSQTISKLDSTRQVFLVPLGSKEASNVFVDSVWLDDAFIRSNTDITLRIQLRNGGSKAVDNCQAKLFVGERQATAFKVSVPASKAVSTSVRLQLTNSQLVQCRIELEDYPVTFDNIFYFTLKPSPKIKVLDVIGSEAAATRQLYANEPLFSYNFTKQAGLNYKTVEAADLVIVQDQPELGVSLRENLRRVVQRGGAIVIVPTADKAGRSTYDQLFNELGVGPIRWENAGAVPVLRDVAMPASQNPFFKDVFGPQNRRPEMPKASPVLSWSRSTTDIMRMRDGEGFLAAFPSGKGTVYLFSSPLSGLYSDFTQHSLFVPVMYRLAMQSYQRQQEPAYRLNQGTIALNVSGESGESSSEQVFKLVKDSLTFIPGQRLQAGVLRFDVPPDMREAGFYSLTRKGQAIANLAFNLDKHESELATYSADELRQLIGPNRKNVQVYDASKGESVAAKYRAERVGTPLWHYCLWAALTCLLAEVLLLRFMRPAKAAESVAMAA